MITDDHITSGDVSQDIYNELYRKFKKYNYNGKPEKINIIATMKINKNDINKENYK